MVDQSSVVSARSLVLALVLMFALATGGCGSSSSAGSANANGSCTISTTVSAGGITLTQKGCEEAEGLSAAQLQAFMQQCMPTSGAGADAGFSQQITYAAGACSRAGAIGGCRITQGGETITTWFYTAGQTAAEIQQQCASAGGTFASP